MTHSPLHTAVTRKAPLLRRFPARARHVTSHLTLDGPRRAASFSILCCVGPQPSDTQGFSVTHTDVLCLQRRGTMCELQHQYTVCKSQGSLGAENQPQLNFQCSTGTTDVFILVSAPLTSSLSGNLVYSWQVQNDCNADDRQ